MKMLFNVLCGVTVFLLTRVVGELLNPDGRIHFPQDDFDQNEGIPLRIARRLNEIMDESDLLYNLVDSGSIPKDVLSERSGFGPNDRKDIRIAKAATCMPEAQTVCLESNHDARVSFYPSCTRIKRCGGCCSHDLLSCQPIETEILKLGVVVTEYLGGSLLTYKGRDVVSVEQHKRCKCDCRIKKKDCTPFQTYENESCRCVCRNQDEQAKCNEEAPKKIWSPSLCACVCRDEIECSTGSYFHPFSCECVPEPTRQKKFADLLTWLQRSGWR